MAQKGQYESLGKAVRVMTWIFSSFFWPLFSETSRSQVGEAKRGTGRMVDVGLYMGGNQNERRFCTESLWLGKEQIPCGEQTGRRGHRIGAS
jgi:hypothetical protein